MAQWIETTTYWHGDLIDIERRRTEACTEGRRTIGSVVEVVRLVKEERHRVRYPEIDLAFLRVVILAAIVHAAFIAIFELTPHPVMLMLEEPLHDPKLRSAILAGDGWRDSRPSKRELAAIPGPKRIVIPTPIGSRVRPHVIEPFEELPVVAYGYGEVAVLTGVLETRVESGVVGGVLSSIEESDTLLMKLDLTSSRCAPLVDYLAGRVLKDDDQRTFLEETCTLASDRALDCLERATSAEALSAADLVAKCGRDLPPALTARLRASESPAPRPESPQAGAASALRR
jgi:hypothetical protein